MGILCERVEDQGTGWCSAQRNFLPSSCGLKSTAAAGLAAADFLTYLAAEDFVGRLFR